MISTGNLISSLQKGVKLGVAQDIVPQLVSCCILVWTPFFACLVSL